MNSENNHIRAFIGISLSKEAIISLRYLQKQLKTYGIKASWPRPETMHLTLNFFEKININKIDMIKACMTRAAAKTTIHTLSLSGIGAFPSIKKPRVIWSGTSGQIDVLGKLVDRLSINFFEDMGIKKENKRFLPHVTVARIKQPISHKSMMKLFQTFKGFGPKDFLVSEIKIFQSVLQPSGGVIHKIIFSAPLKN
ncbi:MAG: RNA 2',3'-cyclic phosphodiesterase [Desulfobacula sp.]|jgi:RNA 2',3'-cyclic 3'-phosphodiesterase|nr:RNA 2',3'-cyclic phosphodiesterase [Desulfobacula sp.]MBT6339141.1 RNA 2',3'-cyclic phosphodiesterase [Desulfobacula sp.]